jgi:multiple sugar transport system permease protein
VILNIGSKWQNRIWLAIFIGPSVAGFLVFYLLPYILGIYYSFIDNAFSRNFVGVANYIQLFQSESFRKAASNTLFFTGICVPSIMLISLMLALLINKDIHFRNVLRTVLVSPLVVPVASVVMFWQILFHEKGMANSILSAFEVEAVDWMNTKWSVVVVLVIYLWKNIGYNLVLFLAGLQNIPRQYYESADIDGASSFKKFTKITLVYLTPTTFFVFIMSIINSFKVFREIYLTSGDYPHDSIYMLQHYMNNTFAALDYQKLTSAAFVMGFVIYILVFVLFRAERKISKAII